MKNPNSPPKRLFGFLKARWTGEDYPGAEPRFQLSHFAKDVAIFVLLPVIAVIVSRSVEKSFSQQKKPQTPQVNNRNQMSGDVVKSEIIDFLNQGSKSPVNKHSPGSLVKLKLLNSVETYSNAPVHAQIIDLGLGRSLLGGILIGDATPDSTFERINIIFRYARDPSRDSVAYSISARALSLNGSLGLVASKREGFFARSVLGSASGTSQNAQVGSNTNDLKDILFRALASGFVQEFSNGSNVEKNRSQVLTLQPETEFFAELTDFFPGGGQK